MAIPFDHSIQEQTYDTVKHYLNGSHLFQGSLELATHRPEFEVAYGSAKIRIEIRVVVYSNGSKFKRVKLCSVPNVVAIDTSRMDARITVNNGISAKTANVSMLRGLNIGIFRQRPGKWSISSY